MLVPVYLIVGFCAGTTSSSAAQSLAEAPTRFGIVNVVSGCESGNFCPKAYAKFGGKTVEVGASSDQIYVTVLATFQVRDGDLIILDIPTGARHVPDQLVALLVRDSTTLEIISNEDFYDAEDREPRVEIGDDRLTFDLDYKDKKRKTAIYAHGAFCIIYATEMQTSLPKSDCAFVLNTVHECLSFDKCTSEAIGAMGGRISMATRWGIAYLANRPEFQSDAFYDECQKICASRKYDALRVRKHLCGF
ncbi:MAG: hypothetical protein WB760_02750 [Xanthobacteraceae bacterium]